VATTASVVGDLKDILPPLIERLEQRERPAWKGRAKTVRDEWGRAVMDYKAQDDTCFNPRKIIKAVRARTSDEMVVVTDVGQHQMWVAQHYGFRIPRTLATSGGLGTMGFGMGGAVGASIARGSIRTLLFTGDGSFHMNMAEFATAVRYKLPIIVIVINNAVLGMVRQWQTLFFRESYSQTTLERPTDYVKLAEALGGTGHQATDIAGLEQALDAAFASDGPVIIECKIGCDEMVFPMIPAGGSFDDMIVERN
jgi:acetolactate synthase-1/2/3 large subunit